MSEIKENEHNESSENQSPKCQEGTADSPQIEEKIISQRQDNQIEHKRKRKWEVFPGGNKFHCNGRCIRAPEYIGYLVTLTLMIVTGVLFFGSDCVYLTKKVGVVIPTLGAPLFLFIIILLHRTTFSDPGIIPRATPEEIEKQEPGYVTDDKKSRYIKREIKDIVCVLPYCSTCKLYRPPRASHCSVCDNCVNRFDHHCPVISNCIGARNYKYFYLLIIFSTIMSCYIIGCNVAVILLRIQELGTKQAFIQSIPSLIESVICLGGLTSGLVCLSGLHTMLIFREETTHEMCRGTFNKKPSENSLNPFSHGRWYLNCFYILCTPSPPSVIDRRGYVDEKISDANNTNLDSPV